MAPKKSSIILNVDKFIQDVEDRPAIWNRNYHCNKPFLEQMWDELSGIHKLPKVVLKAKWKGLRDNFRVEYKRIPRMEVTGEFLIPPQAHESKWIHYYSLLFLTEHMRHRLPKADHETFYFPGQNQDYEKTIVEPDLTNGLIRISESDEEFDEDDIEEDEVTENAKGNKLKKITHKEEKPFKLESESRLLPDCQRSSSPAFATTGATKKGSFSNKSYTNELISSPKLKRKRLSEDSNFNGSSTMDNCPLVPEDDDYHYLLSLHPYMKQLNGAQKLRIRTKIQRLIFKELFKEDIEEIK